MVTDHDLANACSTAIRVHLFTLTICAGASKEFRVGALFGGLSSKVATHPMDETSIYITVASNRSMKMVSDLKPATSITLESISTLLLKAAFMSSEAVVASK